MLKPTDENLQVWSEQWETGKTKAKEGLKKSKEAASTYCTTKYAVYFAAQGISYLSAGLAQQLTNLAAYLDAKIPEPQPNAAGTDSVGDDAGAAPENSGEKKAL